MKLPRLLSVSALAVTLLLTVGKVHGNMPPPFSFSRPKELQEPIVETTRGHLDAAERALEKAINDFENNYASRDVFGGKLKEIVRELTNALIHVREAVAYVQAHPETNSLRPGPVSAPQPKLPLLPRIARSASSHNEITIAVDALTVALEALVNNSDSGYRGPVLDDIGGYRAKIVADIGRAGSLIIVGVKLDHPDGKRTSILLPPITDTSEVWSPKNTGPPPIGGTSGVLSISSPIGGPSLTILQPAPPAANTQIISAAPRVIFEPTEVGDLTIIQIPRSLLGGALTIAASDNGGSRLPLTVSSIALSLGLTFGGLHFFSRKKHLSVPVTLLIVGLVLALATVAVYANGPPRPTTAVTILPSPLPRALPTPPAIRPQVTGPVVVVVVEVGDSVRILMPRKLANGLVAPPAL